MNYTFNCLNWSRSIWKPKLRDMKLIFFALIDNMYTWSSEKTKVYFRSADPLWHWRIFRFTILSHKTILGWQHLKANHSHLSGKTKVPAWASNATNTGIAVLIGFVVITYNTYIVFIISFQWSKIISRIKKKKFSRLKMKFRITQSCLEILIQNKI